MKFITHWDLKKPEEEEEEASRRESRSRLKKLKLVKRRGIQHLRSSTIIVISRFKFKFSTCPCSVGRKERKKPEMIAISSLCRAQWGRNVS